MPTKDDLRDRLADLTRAEVAGAAALVVLLLAAAGLWYWRSLPRAVEVRAVRSVVTSAAPSPSPEPVVVHVAGRVHAPGVYELAPGARLVDAVDAAGGALRDADLDAINLAALAVDGTQIYIPRRGEVPAPSAVGAGGVSADGRIDINTATAAELETLPRVGEVLAQRIVDYRTANGPFATVDDLLDVSGIGQATLDGFRDLITV